MVDSLLLPTLETVPAERAAALGVQQASDITERLRAPLGSVDARARALENNSPLFRDSEAGGQFGLFSDSVTPPALGVSAIREPKIPGSTV